MIRDLIPAKARKVIYTLLATGYALEAIFDVVPAGTETRLVAALTVLGFGMAAVNTNTNTPQEG